MIQKKRYRDVVQVSRHFNRVRRYGKIKQWLRIVIWHLTLSSLYVVKRLIDIAASFCLLVILTPLFGLIGAVIFLDDRGTVFYKQIRVGCRGKEFYIYKFRSMRQDADRMKEKLADQNESANGVIFKMREDPRITRVGRVLRKLSLDELPQLWNVLKGEMSLVGPRPPIPSEVEEYSLYERKRLEIKPGITCIWQVSGRSDIPFNQQVELDLKYIDSSSIKNDVVLLLKTVPAVLFGKGAY